MGKYAAVIITAILIMITGSATYGSTLTASYYTVSSCHREGTSGVMANGRRLRDEAFTAASWDYRFGTRLRVRNLRNNRCVEVEVQDRGPAKRLYQKGRVIDLSYAAMYQLDGIKQGIIPVSIEVIK